MAGLGIGTNFFTAISATASVALTDENGLAMLVKCTGAPPTTADVFAPGALAVRTDSPSLYQNTGTAASPTWTLNSATAGATGATGAAGATGAGTTGATGPQGATGATGPGP